jgi:hypothetical protein
LSVVYAVTIVKTNTANYVERHLKGSTVKKVVLLVYQKLQYRLNVELKAQKLAVTAAVAVLGTQLLGTLVLGVPAMGASAVRWQGRLVHGDVRNIGFYCRHCRRRSRLGREGWLRRVHRLGLVLAMSRAAKRKGEKMTAEMMTAGWVPAEMMTTGREGGRERVAADGVEEKAVPDWKLALSSAGGVSYVGTAAAAWMAMI